jgi:hypothetical protein
MSAKSRYLACVMYSNRTLPPAQQPSEAQFIIESAASSALERPRQRQRWVQRTSLHPLSSLWIAWRSLIGLA